MSTCRLCMAEDRPKLVSVFSDTEDGKLCDKIMFCASIKIMTEDSFPHLVCSPCVDKLHVAYSFRKQCELSDKIFKSKLHSLLKVKTEEIDESDVTDLLKEIKPRKRGHSGIVTRRRRKKIHKFVDKLETEIILPDELDINPKSDLDNDLQDDCDIKVELFDDDNLFDDADYIPCENIESSKENKKRKKKMPKIPREKKVKVEVDGEPKKRGRKPKVYYDEDGQILDKKPMNFYFCEHCGKMFKNRNYLNLHVKLHSNEKNYECSVCAKKFSTQQYMTRHIKIHSDKKLYKCQYCDREFNDWGSRQKHERLHRNEKPYTCDLCGKQFTYSYSLKNHLLVHSGIKMFGCELCKKSFTMKYHLMNHARRRHANLLSSGALLIGTSKLGPDGTKVLDTINKPFAEGTEEEIAVSNLQVDLANRNSVPANIQLNLSHGDDLGTDLQQIDTSNRPIPDD